MAHQQTCQRMGTGGGDSGGGGYFPSTFLFEYQHSVASDKYCDITVETNAKISRLLYNVRGQILVLLIWISNLFFFFIGPVGPHGEKGRKGGGGEKGDIGPQVGHGKMGGMNILQNFIIIKLELSRFRQRYYNVGKPIYFNCILNTKQLITNYDW